ncbi:MAG: sugar nucleotide-binding protein [Pirellulaceae bacterium]
MINRTHAFDISQHRLMAARTFAKMLGNNRRLPLLVTGVSGVAGLNAFAFFRERYGNQVIGQRPFNNWPLSGPGIVGVDLEDAQATRDLIRDGNFKSVLSCGGSCALKSCELDREMAQRVNVGSIESLLDAIEGRDIRLVHLSIDLVYSGRNGGNHVESDMPDPVTIYGSTMVEAEELILQRQPTAAIGRISLPMGVSFNGHAGAIDWIQARFAKDKPATLYYDEVRTPTYVDCLSEICEELLANDVSGVFHLGGTRKLSLNQIAQIVNRVGGYRPENLKGCYRIEAGPIPPRAGNVSLNSNKIADVLGRSPFVAWPYFEELVPTHREWHFDRRGFEGSPALIRKLLYSRPAPNERLADFLG